MKTRFIYLIIIILFTFSFTPAAVEQLASRPVPACGTPVVNQIDGKTYLQRLKQENPLAYAASLEEAQAVENFNKTHLTEKIFYAYNFSTKKYYTLTATLRRTGNLVRIWVENASDQYVTEAVLDEILRQLEESSNASSIDPQKGIVEIDTLLFGQPPNYDGDGIIDFLILDIKDSFNPPDNQEFIAGYFHPNDQTNNPNSNKMDLMYLDAYPGIYYDGNYRTSRVLATTAHEFQHLIHYNYDRYEETWVNEGLSELAGTYCGFGIDFPYLYLEDTRRSLITWDNEVADYSKVNLWTLYCAEQLGKPFIRELVRNPLHGIAGFNAALKNVGLPGTISEVFQGWVVANYLNDRNVDPRYGYQHPDASGLRAEYSRQITEYPTTISGDLKAFAVEYQRFRGRDSLQLNFSNNSSESLFLIRKNNQSSLVQTGLGQFNYPDFNDQDEYVLILFSSFQDFFYEYFASARYSLKYLELSYDDNHADVNLLLSGIVANRFRVPGNNLSLEAVKFWSGSSNFRAIIHVYDESVTHFPRNDLITPVDTFVTIQNAWTTVPLPEPVTGLAEDEYIFAGVEINDSNVGIGYDSSPPKESQSYVNQGSGWRKLSDFTFSGSNEPVDGDLMIRVVFSGYILSGEGAPVTELKVYPNFPNPCSYRNGGTSFRYEIPGAGSIRLVIYNTLGQKIVELTRQHSFAGTPTIHWDGLGIKGRLASGIYFYQIIFTDATTNKTLRTGFHKLLVIE